MRNWLLLVLITLLIPQFCDAGQSPLKAIHDRIDSSDRIIIAWVKDVEEVEKNDGHCEYKVTLYPRTVLKGDIDTDISEFSYTVVKSQDRINAFSKFKKQTGYYILFLKRAGKTYRLIDAIGQKKGYEFFTGDEKCVLSHDELIKEIHQRVTPAALIDFCVKSPVGEYGRYPEKVPAEIKTIIADYQSQGRNDHFYCLVEYGLNIYLKNIQRSGLARELPVKENPLLAELIRIAEIPKYKTAHEAGWLNRQFHNRFEETGYSSYQIYIWYMEHISDVFDFPNADRIHEITKKITKTGYQGVGGSGNCHYGCR